MNFLKLRSLTLLAVATVTLTVYWFIIALLLAKYEALITNATGGTQQPKYDYATMKPVKLKMTNETSGSTFLNAQIPLDLIGDFGKPPGELGKPVVLPKNISKDIKTAVYQGWTRNSFNQYISDIISIRRKVPDPRDEWCKQPGRYLDDLPSTSVVICFHNEAWSTLLRTVHSVIDRSPPHLIKEIILVDDYSDMPHLKQQLNEYMSNMDKVKIIRTPRREGLIRARLLGATFTTAPVITYLDSHCECTEGWLEPLLDRIARNKTTVVSPVIDIIDANTFEYRYQKLCSVGGFDWDLHFRWYTVTRKQQMRRKNKAAPIRSPTIAGGLFAIDKEFFERLGTYDSGFDIWGGENLELSFKTWMCGGTLEIVPCSHVGHVFRKTSPYKWLPGVNVIKKNSVRLAEVWMDDYAKYYYERIGFNKGNYGDISSRKALRNKLGCKSFDWYLKNIYPDRFIPGESIATGEIANRWSKLCLDGNVKGKETTKPIGIQPCHGRRGNQYWMYSKTGEIRRDETCLEWSRGSLVLCSCHGDKGNQLWIYNQKTKQLQCSIRKICMAVSKNKDKIEMEVCKEGEPRQAWDLENFDPDRLKSSILVDTYDELNFM